MAAVGSTSVGGAADDGTAAAAHAADHRRREALSMGLYTAITLMAGLTVTSDESGHTETLLVVWGTTVGLALTHWFTFGLAARLVDPVGTEGHLVEELVSQATAAAVVALLATAAVVVLPDEAEREGARVAAAAVIGAVTFAQLRGAGSSVGRALRGAAAALVLASLIVAVNRAVGH